MNNAFNPRTKFTEAEVMVIIGKYNQFTPEKLISEIKLKHYKFPYIVYAQAKLESGNFKSKIFLENHNMFGMKEAVMRLNTAQGTQFEHAYYNNWKACLEDYGYYYSRYLSGLDTEDEYYEYLSQNYAEDPRYVETLKAMIIKENLKSKFN
jgi:flagellum-specific peptidoglycan hydrolase FlgJ